MRCWVKSRNERNPLSLVAISQDGHSNGTAGDNSEEGGDDVKSSCPLCSGLHTCYNGRNKVKQDREVEQISKTDPSSDCRLQLDSVKSESLVIVDQNATVNAFPVLYTPPVTPWKFGGARSWSKIDYLRRKMTGVKS